MYVEYVFMYIRRVWEILRPCAQIEKNLSKSKCWYTVYGGNKFFTTIVQFSTDLRLKNRDYDEFRTKIA